MPQPPAACSRISARRLALVCLAIATLMSIAVPAPAAVSQAELDKAKAERQAVQKELDKTVAAYDEAQGKLAKTQASVKANQAALAEAEKTAGMVKERFGKRADALYRQGPLMIFQYLIGASSWGDFGRRLTLLEQASNDDAVILAYAETTRTDIARLNQELEQQGAQEQQILGDMSQQTQALTADFAKAQSLEGKLASDRQTALRLEAERKAKAEAEAAARAKAEADARKKAKEDAKKAAAAKPSPSPSGTARPGASPSPAAASRSLTGFIPTLPLHCPVDGPTSFTDTWGQPRSGGRAHEGVDMFAAMGTPVAAVTDGTMGRKISSGAGGVSFYFNGSDGTQYFYAHLSGYAKVETGQKVSAGAHLGMVGDTGNAAGGPPHLHFEVHPGAGPATNPTATVRKACG